MSNRMRMSGEKRISALTKTAGEIVGYKIRMKFLALVLSALVGVTGVAYAASVLYEDSGSFTVSVDKYEMTKYGLSLSESRDLSRPTSNLNAKAAEKMTNIAGETIPDNVDMIDGEHNGRDYIAYTFYVQNAGSVEVSYDYDIKLTGVTNGIDEAIRLRLYVNGGEPVTYAKTRSDGEGAEPGTTEFHSATSMVRGRVESFQPEAVNKYTLVIWLEGNDPDCVDWIIGGKMKIEMDIGVAH